MWCNNNSWGGCSWLWIIILIIILCGCGSGNGNWGGCNSGSCNRCGNSCGC